uniref:Uncharacterized protein n=1 Tax=Salix viminalis TaxID=40686 RepID=A0A6N2MXM1_SALVM
MWLVWHGVDPSREVEWSRKDGDCVRKGMQFGKASALNIVVAERVVLNLSLEELEDSGDQCKWPKNSKTDDFVTMVDAAHPACILKTKNCSRFTFGANWWRPESHNGFIWYDYEKDNHMSIAEGIINAIKSIDWYLEQRNLQMEVEILKNQKSRLRLLWRYIKLDNMVIPLPNGDVELGLFSRQDMSGVDTLIRVLCRQDFKILSMIEDVNFQIAACLNQRRVRVRIDRLEDIAMAVITVLNMKTENDYFKNGFFC